MTAPDATPDPAPFPMLLGAQVEAHALIVRRQTCDELAAILRDNGHTLAANLVDEDRDFTELSRSLAAIPSTPKPQHRQHCRPFDCRCGCDRAQDCLDCHRCVCWRAQCCAQAAADHARTRTRRAALRRLLDSLDLEMLTELRETVAEAEENALRNTIARRLHLLAPANGRRYTHAVFAASRSKLGMSHADYRPRDVELYDEEHDTPTTVDLNDEVLSAALGTLATLLRPDDDAELTVDLTCPVTTTG
ncbi:hypothetical protein [Streptomyces rhizosphaericus]|uniref:hypothetical protein n=2 Tax=Streptomyces rhizosphaericus TaxID=114699 RepID=UPI0031D1C6B8